MIKPFLENSKFKKSKSLNSYDSYNNPDYLSISQLRKKIEIFKKKVETHFSKWIKKL